VLANSLYELKGVSISDISTALAEYKAERYIRVKAQYEASKMDARLIYGQVNHACPFCDQKTITLAIFNHRFFFFFIVYLATTVVHGEGLAYDGLQLAARVCQVEGKRQGFGL
jgi:hypothetical protein